MHILNNRFLEFLVHHHTFAEFVWWSHCRSSPGRTFHTRHRLETETSVGQRRDEVRYVVFCVRMSLFDRKSIAQCLELCFKSVRYLVTWIQQLNLFKLAANRTMDDIKQQRVTTRCYLFVLASTARCLTDL